MTNVVVTGADGFLGRAVTRQLAAQERMGSVLLVDRTAPTAPDRSFKSLAADLSAPGMAASICGEADIVIHLAGVLGGAAEAAPALSRLVNLDTSLTLIERLATRPSPARLVYASTIAIFGPPLSGHIDDATLPLPTMTYGAHKLMVETAMADAARRGEVEGVALRLPGLVARPGSGTGLKSAFLSGIFHALAAGKPFEAPVGPAATVWIMSVEVAARNLVRAAFGPFDPMCRTALTLPAVFTRMDALTAEIIKQTGGGTVTYAPDPALEAQFGSCPPLDATLARYAGYEDDGDLTALVQNVLAAMEENGT